MVFVTKQNICAVKERRNGLGEPGWSVLNTHGMGAGSAALDPRLHPACWLCRKKVKTFSGSLLLCCVHITWGFFCPGVLVFLQGKV